MRDYEAEEALKEEIQRRRRARMRRERRRRRRRKKILLLSTVGIFLLFLLFAGITLVVKGLHKEENPGAGEIQRIVGFKAGEVCSSLKTTGEADNKNGTNTAPKDQENQPTAAAEVYEAKTTEDTAYISSESVPSTNAVLIDLDENIIVAQKNAFDRINPASMTKILTLLVAVEHVENLDDTFTMTREITDYSYSNDCSAVGFEVGEVVTVRDLLYGTILPSGGDAAAGLAYYVSGSLEGFTELLNQKLDQLGLSDTAHFTNCVGLYDEAHYCSVYDMAVILKAAMDQPLCREILSARIYTTSATAEHPEGLEISNWFLRRIEDKEIPGEVAGAKTGYVLQSGNCGASYAVSDTGRNYICVTANAYSSWRCIYDHVEIYNTYMK